MGRAYGTPIPQTMDGPQLGVAERQELERLNRFYGAPVTDVVWRIEAVRYSGCELDVNGGENYYLTDPRLELFALPVFKWTEHGATLVEHGGSYLRRRWVDLRDGNKQYASRSPEQALAEFRTRRERQIYILKRQLARAEREFQLANFAPSPRPLLVTP